MAAPSPRGRFHSGRRGKPSQSRSASGSQTVWVYNTYYERYDGTRFAGYSRRVYFDPYLKSYRVHYFPVYADAYRPEVQENIRVVFENEDAFGCHGFQSSRQEAASAPPRPTPTAGS